jgi:uncharacterized protein YgbK (DUF1537 family)
MKNIKKHSPLVAVIADDLTSAADGAAPFLNRGLTGTICSRRISQTQADVLSIDTASRNLDTEAAKRVVNHTMQSLTDATYLYKTIDSTLRGHIKEELNCAYHSAIESGNYDAMVIAPAFADAGRITINGKQFVNGISVCESIYAKDPVHPATTSNIADLIDPLLDQPIIIPQHANSEHINNALSQSSILILDADSQCVLNQQVSLIPTPERILWVGSPGIGIALAELIEPRLQKALQLNCTKILIVIGSANPASRAQAEFLESQGIPLCNVTSEIDSNCNIACLVPVKGHQSDPKIVLAHLTAQANKAINIFEFDTIIATGGETMDSILNSLAIKSFSLFSEIEPGFSVGQCTNDANNNKKPLVIAMKAGGFGSPSTLLNGVKKIQQFSLKI